jgi:hypothetical protein
VSAGDLAIVIAAVLCCLGFAALVVVLVRVLDALRALRGEVTSLRADPAAARRAAPLDRGRARCDARGARRPRPVRPRARLGGGDQRRGERWEPDGSCRVQHPGDQDGRARHRHVAGGAPVAAQRSEIRMMKRLTWFVSGAVAGVAGAGVAKRKVKQTAAALSPSNVASGAAHRIGDAVREGRRAMHAREVELRAGQSGAQPVTLADELHPDDTVLVDGEPVEPGKVIVLRQVQRSGDAASRRRRRA